MPPTQSNEQMKMAVMWYMVGQLPELRKYPYALVKQITEEASQLSAENALHLVHTKEYVVPSWGPQKLSGGQVISLMVAGLWVLCGEDECIAHPVVDQWPIREALALCGKKETNPIICEEAHVQ